MSHVQNSRKVKLFSLFFKLCKQFRTGMNGSRQHLISLKKVNEPFNCRFFSVKSITVHCSWLIFNFHADDALEKVHVNVFERWKTFFSKINILLKMWHNLRKNVSNSFYLYFHNINFLEIQHLAFKYLFDKNGILSRKRYRCLHTLFWQISDMTMEWLIRFILTSTSLEYCKQDLEVHVGCEEVKVVEGYKTIWKLFKITTSYFIQRRVCKWIFSSTICRSLISKIFE